MSVIFMIVSVGGTFMSAWFAYQAVIEGSPDKSARPSRPHQQQDDPEEDIPTHLEQGNSFDQTEEQ